MKKPLPDFKKVITGIFALLFLFLTIYILLVKLEWYTGLGPIVTFIIAFSGALAIKFGGDAMIKKYEDSKILSSKAFPIISVCVCVIVVFALAFNFYLDLRVGYKKGDYSEYECSLCGDSADGGVFVSGRDIENYYCEHHFEWVKKRAEEIGKDPTESEIWYEAQRIVENKLKAPSTAEFCSISEASISKRRDTWIINGYVDAENSFGVKIRNDFSVVITFTSDTAYTIDECSITAR